MSLHSALHVYAASVLHEVRCHRHDCMPRASYSQGPRPHILRLSLGVSHCDCTRSQGAAYCTGRGEIVEDVKPPLPLNTPMLLVSLVLRRRRVGGGWGRENVGVRERESEGGRGDVPYCTCECEIKIKPPSTPLHPCCW